MRSHLALLIPFACALIYVFGALAVKRAAMFGVGVWRTSFLSNWAVALLFVPVWFWQHGQIHPVGDYWQPALIALLFLGGQSFLFIGLSRGDVSVLTPVLGTKVIFVALLSSLLRVGDVPLRWWIGAALSTTAIGLLHLGEEAKHRKIGWTVFMATCSAASFSLSDVLLQKWLPVWGAGSFLPPLFLIVGVVSFAFVPLFSAPLTELSVSAWRWVGPGVLLMALNNAGIVLAIGIIGNATAVNIVYSVRGLFSVVLVWWLGHWFSSEEKHLAGRVLRFRLIGSALMAAAIVLVLI